MRYWHVLLAFALFVLPSLVCACSVSDVLGGTSSSNCSRYILAVDQRGAPVKYFLLPADRNTVILEFTLKNYDDVDGAVCISASKGLQVSVSSGDLCFTVPARGGVPVSLKVAYDPKPYATYYLYYSTPFDTMDITLLVYPDMDRSPFGLRFWLENVDLLVALIMIFLGVAAVILKRVT